MKRFKWEMGEIIRTWGPAWLVMIADVDAASAITAADSGAQYGTKLVWFLMLLVIPLYVIQEVAGRVGAVTSKGFGEPIRSCRERYQGLSNLSTPAFSGVKLGVAVLAQYYEGSVLHLNLELIKFKENPPAHRIMVVLLLTWVGMMGVQSGDTSVVPADLTLQRHDRSQVFSVSGLRGSTLDGVVVPITAGLGSELLFVPDGLERFSAPALTNSVR